MPTTNWRGHLLTPELTEALVQIDEAGGRLAIKAGEISSSFANIWTVLDAVYQESLIATQLVVEVEVDGAIETVDRWEVWDLATDETVGPMSTEQLISFAKGIAIIRARENKEADDRG